MVHSSGLWYRCEEFSLTEAGANVDVAGDIISGHVFLEEGWVDFGLASILSYKSRFSYSCGGTLFPKLF